MAVWLLVVAICAAGLSRYRVENDLSQWSTAEAHARSLPGMLVLAWEPGRSGPQEEQLRSELTAVVGVERCQPVQELLLAAHVAPVADRTAPRCLTGVLILHEASIPRATLIDRVHTACRSAGLERSAYYLSGPTAISAALDDWSQRGLQTASLLIGVTGLVGVWLFSRRLVLALRVSVAVFGSQLLLTGTLSWLGVPMDMMLSAVPPLMMALGFSFAMHRTARSDTRVPILLCGATTAAGFMTLAWSNAPAIRAFATWGAAGITLAWLSVMVWVPASAQGREATQPQNAARIATSPMRTMVLCGAVALTLLTIPAAATLTVRDNPMSGLPAGSLIRRDTEQIDRRLVGTLPSLVHTETAGLTADDIGAWPGVEQVVAVPNASVTASGETWLVLSRNGSVRGMADAVAASGAEWSGPGAQVSAMGQSVIATALWALPFMSLLVLAALLWVAQDWIAALLGLWVCLIPVMGIMTAVSALGLPVSLTGLMSGAIALGVAVDDTLHILHHRRRTSTAEAVRACRCPCVHSSLIAAGCVAWLMTAPFAPTAEFGLLLACMIMAALVADLIVLPAALDAIPHRPTNPESNPLTPKVLAT